MVNHKHSINYDTLSGLYPSFFISEERCPWLVDYDLSGLPTSTAPKGHNNIGMGIARSILRIPHQQALKGRNI